MIEQINVLRYQRKSLAAAVFVHLTEIFCLDSVLCHDGGNFSCRRPDSEEIKTLGASGTPRLPVKGLPGPHLNTV